ncbi:arylsulfatase [Stratiformator vulcanicus]|uniref:Arylsulfatase n=1 Tax=Stratiformator vulcanicus TaxID=2527980 RepID=A0A517QYU7_9PLAN|nr:arylsulfatase [Stratiformator vulcanicus]QDT36778.1 Arylsulfatase precursor [Stratiformator vulcanicus]
MNKPLIAAVAVSCLICSFVAAAEPPADDRPNVVLIMTDDQGWGDLSASGNQNLKTPHIDSLKRDGVSLEYFYVCPVCSPTRAELLTGRYHPRGNVYDTSEGAERLDLDEHTLGESFQAAGYRSGAFGKWHNGSQPPYHPNDRGFNEFYGFCSGHWGHYFSPPLERNGKMVRGDGYVTDDFTSEAIKFIEDNRDRPFVCYLPYCTPHAPMQVPDEYFDRFKDKKLTMRHRDPQKEKDLFTKAALAMCENIDFNVGRVLKTLEQLDLSGNTIVVYLSDNGPNSYRWNGGMKGRKASTDEGGVRVPLFIRWDDRLPAGRSINEIASAIDLFPTLADLAGVEILAEKPLDGVSLAPLLRSDQPDWPERLVYSHWAGKVSVRSQHYRLDDRGRLFDMRNDFGQRNNIADQEPEQATRLKVAAEKWRTEVLTEIDRTPRPFTVGYRDTTWLPARDATPHGHVRRSNRWPNSSYMTDWTSPKDRIVWNVDVINSGTYEATLFYTCPESQLGSVVTLTDGKSRTSAEVTEAFDPALIGHKEDRFPRKNTYHKDFRPLRMGELKLSRGETKLTLQAEQVANTSVMDMRYLKLVKKQAD